jgi:hypothetical protein
MLNSESVHRYWKIKTVGQLKQTGLPFLQDEYRKIIKEKVFKIRKLETRMIPFSDGIELIRGISDQRDWFFKFVSLCSGLNGIEQTFGSIDQFFMSASQVFQTKKNPRMAMKRLRDNLNSLIQDQAKLELNTDGISQMYDELYRKICA